MLKVTQHNRTLPRKTQSAPQQVEGPQGKKRLIFSHTFSKSSAFGFMNSNW